MSILNWITISFSILALLINGLTVCYLKTAQFYRSALKVNRHYGKRYPWYVRLTEWLP